MPKDVQLKPDNPKIKSDPIFELWRALDGARSALGRARELELAQYGITVEQGAVLRLLLTRLEPTTNADIADIMIRQYNSVTTLVNRMEKLGLVKKEKSSNDRKFFITITPRGKDIYENATVKSIRLAFSDLSNEDRKKFLSYLKHVLDKSRDMLGMNTKLPFLS